MGPPPHISDTLQVLDNGIIILPAVKSNGGSGGMYRRNADCEDLGGHMVEMTPEFEGDCAWAEYWLKKEYFSTAKKYELTIRVKTDAGQGDVDLAFKLKQQEPFYETTIAVPNTNGGWVTLGPLLLDVDIGGFKNTLFKFTINGGMSGQIFHIKDFTFAPPGSDESGEYSGPWWSDWLDRLNAKVVDGGMLPSLEGDDKASLNTTFDAMRVADKVLHDAKDDESVQEANEQAIQDCATAADSVLDAMDGTLSESLLDDVEFLQWLVLVRATPTTLGAYCHQASDEEIQNLVKLLKEDTKLLKLIIVSGGANDGFYGKACGIYNEIGASMQKGKAVLPKLQLAIALELCKPIPIFDTVTPVDPIQRYFDYEKAYLNGELDPAIEQFSVWELRMVVDSDASNEELEWGRKMIMTYRPDIAYMGDQLWRYSSIVKTDVKYGRPDWTSSPRDMVQALCRGGQCGPRAWFGRFVNKAFGTPTWGVIQPGHAALSKWTPTGWSCCLGGDNGRWGNRWLGDFKCEVYMRKAFGDEHYFTKVDLLREIGLAMDEKPPGKNQDPVGPWHTLSWAQRKRQGETNEAYPQSEVNQCEVLTKIEELQQREEPEKEEINTQDDGTIIIPSSAFHEERKAGKAVFAKSLDGGMQYNAEENWWLEYRIPAEMVGDRKKYLLTMRISSVHDDDLHPFQWIVTSAHNTANPMKEYSVPHPYTKGMWGETDPVEIEIGGGVEILKVMRESPCWPITVKDYKLTPV